jgi:hypothetical protein
LRSAVLRQVLQGPLLPRALLPRALLQSPLLREGLRLLRRSGLLCGSEGLRSGVLRGPELLRRLRSSLLRQVLQGPLLPRALLQSPLLRKGLRLLRRSGLLCDSLLCGSEGLRSGLLCGS